MTVVCVGNTHRKEHIATTLYHGVYCSISAGDDHNSNCAPFVACFVYNQSVSIRYTIEYAGADMLNDNCEPMLECAPTSRADGPANDCI